MKRTYILQRKKTIKGARRKLLTGRQQLGKTHTKLPGRLSVFVGLHNPLLFPPYLLVLRTKAFPQLQIKRGGPVVVVEGV